MMIDEFVGRLTDLRRQGSGWTARCPNHEDQHNSLSVNVGDDGRILVKCHAGCDTADVVSQMGLTMKDLTPRHPQQGDTEAIYDYTDENGGLKYQAIRKRGKRFAQRCPDGQGGWIWSTKDVQRYPYRLTDLLESTSEQVFVVEGEKDVDRLRQHDLVATCNVGGAGKWTDSLSPWLAGRSVVILPDNDNAGREHAKKVAKSLDGIARSVLVLELPGLPQKGDVSDWLDQGHSVAELKELVASPRTAGIASLRDATMTFIDRLRGEQPRLIDSGISELDYAVSGGFEHGEQIVVAGRPGHGKSAIGMQMVYSLAKQGMSTLVISEEMGTAALAKRTIQFASDIEAEHWRYRPDALQADVEAHFGERSPIYVVHDVGSAASALEIAQEAKSELGIRAVMIDYAQLLRGVGRSRYDQVTDVSVTLSKLARQFGLLTVVLCQLNRGIESRQAIIPSMSDLRDSGQLEQDADVIVFGVWPLKIKPSHKPIDDYLLHVAKCRHREIRQPTVKCRFDPRRMRVNESRGSRREAEAF